MNFESVALSLFVHSIAEAEERTRSSNRSECSQLPRIRMLTVVANTSVAAVSNCVEGEGFMLNAVVRNMNSLSINMIESYYAFSIMLEKSWQFVEITIREDENRNLNSKRKI